MSKKPNRQIKTHFFRNRHGEYCRNTNTYLYDGTFRWSVRVEIVDHDKGYIFLDQNNHSMSFPNLGEAKEYAAGVVVEVTAFLNG